MNWQDERAAMLARGLTAADRARLDQLRQRAAEEGAAPPAEAGDRWLNVRPDPVDFRDRFFEPGLRSLRTRLAPDPSLLEDIPVRDQQVSKACTGMALATAIDLLRWRRWREDGGDPAERPKAASAWMLYAMAQAFDEFPDDGLFGSSVRGAIRGFFHNGVCDEAPEDLDNLPLKPWRLTVERAKAARGVSLGVYMRLKHVLLDYHAALNEIGVLLVSARIHANWLTHNLAEDGAVIAWDSAAESLGLHAFLLVGYDARGFLVRNSWGPMWGGWVDRAHDRTGTLWPGIAHWSYDDWQRNAIDAWALRLAVSPPDQFNAVGGQHTAGGLAAPTLSRTPPRIAINGHYLNIADGKLVESGVFNCHQDSIQETADLLAKSEKYRHLVLIVESGLDGLATMTHRAAVLTPYMKALGVYPIFVLWREDVFALTAELLEDRARRLEARSGGFAALSSLLLDRFAREFMPPVWRTFEGEVERAFSTSDPSRGRAWPAVRPLLAAALQNPRPLQLHFVAHGTGALWLNKLLQRLAASDLFGAEGDAVAARRRAVSTIDLLAPICSPDSFRDTLTALWGSPMRRAGKGAPVPVALYSLAEDGDAGDRVGAFQGSFLELARRAFPIDGAVPSGDGGRCAVLGHASEAAKLSRRTDTTRLVVGERPVLSPCRSHRGLASDVKVLTHVLGRIRQAAAVSDRAAPDRAAPKTAALDRPALDLPESALRSLDGG
jgi:hypothetical protein